MSKGLGDIAHDILGRYGVSDENGNVQAFPAQSINEHQTSHAPPSMPPSTSVGGTPVHEALPPMDDSFRDMFIKDSLIAEGKMKDLSIRAEEGDKKAQQTLDNLNSLDYDVHSPIKKKRKKKLTKEELEVLKAAHHILQEMTTVGMIGVNMGGAGGVGPSPSYKYPGIDLPSKKKKKKPKKKQLNTESHVTQGDPMFSKAWNSGIITKVPDKKTMYFTGKPQKIKRRKK